MCDCAPTHISMQEIDLSEHLVPVFDVECNSGLLSGTLLVLCCVELLLITVVLETQKTLFEFVNCVG